MLDKSIPHLGVLMEKLDTGKYPNYGLPSGFTFVRYEAGFEHAWSQLQYGLGQTNSLSEAEQIFQDEFLSNPEALLKKCVFVQDSIGNIVASASLWRGNHFGKELQRVHWVGVLEQHQGKGIAKALLTRIFDIYRGMGFSDYIYLTSQTWSYPAINIYLSFGFKPYLGEKPLNWKSDDVTFDDEKTKAWTMILSKIREYESSKSAAR
ncbi:MAG: GNAT family N-acetyltransferase [Dehalococcoidales bacterium]|nr:GNAT family N-acetyltransferase [Dehalococcoidales bacterium]